jgi:hypothetical protein
MDFLNNWGGNIQTAIRMALFLTAVGLLVYFIVSMSNTMPLAPMPRLIPRSEGFEDAKIKVNPGADIPRMAPGPNACLAALPEAQAVYNQFVGKVHGVESGPGDLQELNELLTKWGCLKMDLQRGGVQATRLSPYNTYHDNIPLPDIAGQCSNKSLPLRDLDITFQAWSDRATLLLRRLCTAANITIEQTTSMQTQVMRSWKEVYELAKGTCIGTEKMDSSKAVGHEPEDLVDKGVYSGYF